MRHIEQTMRGALEQFGGAFRRAGSWWHFGSPGADGQTVAAAIDGEWLLLRAPLANDRIHGPAVAQCAWELAERNARLRGPAKVCIRSGTPCVELAAQVLLKDQDDLAVQLRGACADLEDARRAIESRPEVATGPADGPEGPIPLRISELVQSAGWPFTQRTDGALAIPLECHDGHYHALARGSDNGIRACLALDLDGELTAVSRQAIGVLLLTAGGTVRMIRGAVAHEGVSASAILEVHLREPATAQELNHALGALSLGAGLCAEAIPALRDQRIALEYLMLRGWSPRLRPEAGEVSETGELSCLSQKE